MLSKIVKLYLTFSPIPLILSFFILFQLNQMSEWSAIGAAGSIQWIITLSFILLIFGVVLIWLSVKRDISIRPLIISTILSSSVFFGFLIRIYFI
jgi:hypothetical protein